jgi:hypothetical protein
VNYVDAGYSIGLGILFLYAVALGLRRRRWERALRVVQRDTPGEPTMRVAEHAEEQAAPGARS